MKASLEVTFRSEGGVEQSEVIYFDYAPVASVGDTLDNDVTLQQAAKLVQDFLNDWTGAYKFMNALSPEEHLPAINAWREQHGMSAIGE